ncbi:hypothetical protein E6C60_2728 [Paenibacillus algicola]|uniref:Divergent polysaccharide deacetylase n=2 Tax=Paenibacillus algicola TaxID=2565926 RepID=A0A4P8XNX3_9BACL|nr:hypothetical protein E6C60_2728 [Paenibacillus algicola]
MMNKLILWLWILGVLSWTGTVGVSAEGFLQGEEEMLRPGKVSIIIDDFGSGQKGTEEMLQLPVKITAAVMPFLSTSREDAERAHAAGHDVIIHMPMEPRQGKASWLGPGAITTSMSHQEIRQTLEAAIQEVPHAVGMNNHMGSRITGDERIMSVVLEVCREHGLFFVDSKTNYRSVAGRLAVEKGLPDISNHLFLDDIHTKAHVVKQLKLASEYGAKHQYCVTIGHVGIDGLITAQGLSDSVAELQRQGVEFIGISQLVLESTGWSRDVLPLR